MSVKIVFRPHHFLCTLGFRGKGYHPKFVENYQKIVDQLEDNTLISVTMKADAVCEPCPHRVGDNCHKDELIQGLDKAYQEKLRLMDGEVLSWGEAKARIKEHVSLSDFDQICKVCEWQSLGYCKEGLNTLLQGDAV